MTKTVTIAFDPKGIILPIASILPLKQLKPAILSTQKYQQVLSSVAEVGVIEPLIVFPEKSRSDSYLLLDGHIRLAVLKQIGEVNVRCLISTDDETYTYNRRVNRMATIKEHAMILKAIRSGVSEERIAKVLKLDISQIRGKRDLLNGICKECAELLKNKHVSMGVFSVLRKLKPMRQIEVAELLLASSVYSVPYAKALLAATPSDMLLEPDKHKAPEGLTPEQVTKMEKEMEILQRDLTLIEETHGNQVLNLVIARSYLVKLFNNNRVGRYLGHHHPDVYRELQMVCEGSSLEN
jgi:hypothetical protein